MELIVGQVIYGVSGRSSYVLAPLDERALFEEGADIDQMLGCALGTVEGKIRPDELGALPIVDLELILAHFCIRNFGDVVGHNITCASCKKKFAVEFSLGTYVRLLMQEVVKQDRPAFDGAPIELPTRDMIREGGELIRRVWQRADPPKPAEVAALEVYLEKSCPVLQEDIKAACPECASEQSYRFVLRDWIAAKLKSRMHALLAQVHVLASTYHWRVDEIFALSRQSRLALFELSRSSTARSRPVGVG